MRIAAVVITACLLVAGLSRTNEVFAQASQGQAANSSALSNSSDSGVLQEVVVTAEKKNENLLETPVPVSVLAADQLLENNLVRFEDYYTSVPGLSFAPNNQNNYLAIRGIATGGFSNPTVGIVIDEVPFGGSTA